MTDHEPIEPLSEPGRSRSNRHYWAIAAGVVSVALVGSIAAGLAMAGGGADGKKANDLKTAAQGYYDAMIEGNTLGMSAYMTKDCQEDFGLGMLGGEMLKQVFDGVTRLKVTKVKVEGDRGEILDGKVEGKISDATKRLFEDSSDDKTADVWQYVNGKWYTTCDKTATPVPTPTNGA